MLTTPGLLKSYFRGPMAIHFHHEDIQIKLKHKTLIKSWIKQSIASENRICGTINIIFCSDDYLLEINRQHLNHDYYTDIITFDFSVENTLNGDLYISIERVRDNAQKIGVDFYIELYRVVIHGVMHLAGYKDKTKTDALEMRGLEEKYIHQLPKMIAVGVSRETKTNK